MVKGKKIRDKGKIRLSNYFKKFEVGETVAIIKELGVRAAFPMRIIGKTGKIIATRGMYKVVELNDGNKAKKFIVHPIHLKKIQ